MIKPMLLIGTDKQRLQQWEAALARKTKSIASLPDAKKYLSGLASGLCLVDVASVDDDQQSFVDLVQENPQISFLILVAVPEVEDGLLWLRSGAKAYVNRLLNDNVLQAAVGAVEKGEIWAGKLIVQHLLSQLQQVNEPQNSPINSLTGREKQIAELVAEGKNNKEIASQLNIVERTVKAHLSAIFKKLNINSRVQLALQVEQAKKAGFKKISNA